MDNAISAAQQGDIWEEGGKWFRRKAPDVVVAICGAKRRKREGLRCLSPVVNENGRCRLHGGTTPKGIQSPNWKDGRHSRYMGGALREKYIAARSDPDLLQLRSEVELVDARLGELLERVHSGESGALWRKVSDAFKVYTEQLDAERRGVQGADATGAFNRLSNAIENGMLDYAAWDDIGKQVDRRQRLVDAERKHLLQAKQMITAEQFMETLQFVQGVILKHVSDTHIRAAIGRDFGSIWSQPTGRMVDSGAH